MAVRSIATAEDLAGTAFAGQRHSFLHVMGHGALLDVTRRCWASLFTNRAVAYRRRLGIAPHTGILFTANPVSGARAEKAIAASPGLGEAVVAGLVTSHHYVVDRRGRLRCWSPGRREVVVRGRSATCATRPALPPPLFQRAAVVVADTGGPASHATIVAREYCIPPVMGTGAAPPC